MTESERGTGLSVPPPPPWAVPAAPQAQPEAEAASPVEVANGDGAHESAAQAPTATHTATATQAAGYAPTAAAPPEPPGSDTVTVSSAVAPRHVGPNAVASNLVASNLVAPNLVPPKPPPMRTTRGGKTHRPLIVMVIALAVVVVTAVTLAVIPRSSPASVTTPVDSPVGTLVGDDAPPPEDTVPTSPPSTAPPTTQALPPAQVVTRITTTDPVVFITIDDGWHVPPEALAQLMSGTVPITTFLLGQVLDKDPEMWKGLDTKAGAVENHSISHPNFAKLNLQQQMEQICSTSEDIATKLGHYPTMFRPPYGSTNAQTVVAAGNCGIKYVVKWGASVNGGKVTFASGDALRPGDIVLMHYRPELAGDLAAVLAATQAAGLKPALLTDYLK